MCPWRPGIDLAVKVGAAGPGHSSEFHELENALTSPAARDKAKHKSAALKAAPGEEAATLNIPDAVFPEVVTEQLPT